MPGTSTITRLLALLALLLPWGSALAQWDLDNTRSSLSFVSIKNDRVGELHRFDSLIGYIGADGAVKVSIDLDSVQTMIEIRNERMREMLFETVKFPTATVTTTVEPALVASATTGDTLNTEIPVTLSLHGVEGKLRVPVVVTAGEDDSLRVFTPRPVLVNAGDFGLEAGVNALREIAGLTAISTAIPVTMHLVFTPAS